MLNYSQLTQKGIIFRQLPFWVTFNGDLALVLIPGPVFRKKNATVLKHIQERLRKSRYKKCSPYQHPAFYHNHKFHYHHVETFSSVFSTTVGWRSVKR